MNRPPLFYSLLWKFGAVALFLALLAVVPVVALPFFSLSSDPGRMLVGSMLFLLSLGGVCVALVFLLFSRVEMQRSRLVSARDRLGYILYPGRSYLSAPMREERSGDKNASRLLFLMGLGVMPVALYNMVFSVRLFLGV